MNILSWNCRRINACDSPTIPYICWFLSQLKLAFLFFQETKTSVANVHHMLRFTNPTSCQGVDADDTRGGLVLFCWGGPYVVDVMERSGNFLFCKISAINGKVWYCLFLYGESQQQHRASQ